MEREYRHIADALHDLTWVACHDPEYGGDAEAADALLTLPAVEGLTASAMQALMAALPGCDLEERVSGSNSAWWVWGTPRFGGRPGTWYYVIWVSPHISEEVYVLTWDAARTFCQRAAKIVTATPEDEATA